MEKLYLSLLDPPDAPALRVVWRTRTELAAVKKKDKGAPAAAPAEPEQGSGTLEAFAEAYRSRLAPREVHLLLPGVHLTYTRVAITIRNQRQMMQALPFLVEEQVIGNIEDMHIATPARIAGDTMRIAIIERSLLEGLKQRFAALAIPLQGVYGVPDVLPCSESAMHILMHDRLAAVKSAAHCFECDLDSLDAMLEMIGLDGVTSVTVACDPNDADAMAAANRLRVAWAAEAVQLSVVPTVGDWLDYLMATAPVGLGGSLNILLGDGSAAASTAQLVKKYLPVAWAVFLCVCLQVAFNLSTGYYFHRYATRVASNLSTRYLALFPEETRIVDLGSQLKGKLASSRYQAKSRSFPDVFAAAVSVMMKTGNMKDIHLKQFRYDQESGELKMGLDLSSVALLDRIKQGLIERAYTVDIVSANEEGGSIKATLTIKHS